jgi:uncharacterized glyoxalase superfamily protein PhnB
MQLPARITLVTLACRDVERMASLFRVLGWPETPGSDEHHRTFECTNGVTLALYSARSYEPEFGPPTAEFRGTTLCVNLASFAECVEVYETLRAIPDVELLEEPTEASWGGGFSWRDPEGNVWDVAWARDARLDDRGGVHFP